MRELIDIGGGRRLHLWRAGDGRPALVVATSLGEPGYGWSGIQGRLAEHTTVVVYDRANLGWSDPGPWPTGQRMVDDLHALLRAAGIPPPYVLVGHSLGGLLMQLYAARYRDDVAGLVLVDSSHPLQERRLRQGDPWRYSRAHWWLRAAKIALRPLGAARLRSYLQVRRSGVIDVPRGIPQALAAAVAGFQHSSRQRRGDVKEMLAFSAIASEVSRAVSGRPGRFGRLPLTVLTRAGDDPEIPWPAHLEAIWQELQADLAGLSTEAIHLHAPTGDHFIHLANPVLVVEAITTMVARIRATSECAGL